MTIQEVAKKYNLSEDTLRYYEKAGMIPRFIGPRRGFGIINPKILAGSSSLLVYAPPAYRSKRSPLIPNSISKARRRSPIA
jgi:hypothetical protein